jgi:hypothetical protein
MEKLIEANLIHQQEELLKLQILIYSLVDELIDKNLIDKDSLNEQINKKIKVATDLVEQQQKEITINTYAEFSKVFNGPNAEA